MKNIDIKGFSFDFSKLSEDLFKGNGSKDFASRMEELIISLEGSYSHKEIALNLIEVLPDFTECDFLIVIGALMLYGADENSDFQTCLAYTKRMSEHLDEIIPGEPIRANEA